MNMCRLISVLASLLISNASADVIESKEFHFSVTLPGTVQSHTMGPGGDRVLTCYSFDLKTFVGYQMTASANALSRSLKSADKAKIRDELLAGIEQITMRKDYNEGSIKSSLIEWQSQPALKHTFTEAYRPTGVGKPVGGPLIYKCQMDGFVDGIFYRLTGSSSRSIAEAEKALEKIKTTFSVTP